MSKKWTLDELRNERNVSGLDLGYVADAFEFVLKELRHRIISKQEEEEEMMGEEYVDEPIPTLSELLNEAYSHIEPK